MKIRKRNWIVVISYTRFLFTAEKLIISVDTKYYHTYALWHICLSNRNNDHCKMKPMQENNANKAIDFEWEIELTEWVLNDVWNRKKNTTLIQINISAQTNLNNKWLTIKIVKIIENTKVFLHT